MHQHFADRFNAIDFGVRTELRMVDSVGGSMINVRQLERASEQEQAKARAAAEAADKPPGATPSPNAVDKQDEPAATTQAKAGAQEIIKDGAVSDAERAVLKADPKVQEAVKAEQERLAASREERRKNDTNGALVEDLASDRRPPLEEIDAQLETPGISPGVKSALEELRRARVSDEGKVANVIKEREAHIGTLEVEKIELQDAGTTDTESVLDDPDVKHAFEAFATNDGQVYGGAEWFGDDWDNIGTVEGQDTLKELAEHFRANPDQLDEWVSRQGNGDDAIDDAGGADKHVDTLLKDGKLAEATKVDIRTKAAEDLKQAFIQYGEEYASGADTEARIVAIDASIAELEAFNERDAAVLSKETRDDLNAHFVADAEQLPATDTTTTPEDAPTSPGHVGSADAMERRAEDAQAKAEAEAGANDTTSAPESTPGTGQVDYTTPEAQAEVVTQATEAGLLPVGTAFDTDGNAYYTVQPGDSYWAIAERSSAGGFDAELFCNVLAVNTERLGRQADPALIHPGEQLVLPGRSLADLVALLDQQA